MKTLKNTNYSYYLNDRIYLEEFLRIKLEPNFGKEFFENIFIYGTSSIGGEWFSIYFTMNSNQNVETHLKSEYLSFKRKSKIKKVLAKLISSDDI